MDLPIPLYCIYTNHHSGFASSDLPTFKQDVNFETLLNINIVYGQITCVNDNANHCARLP